MKRSALFINATALVVILGISVSVFMISWVSNQNMLVNRPTAIHYALDGNIYIATPNDLLITSKYGEHRQTLPLKTIGIGGVITQISLLSSGEMLIAASGNSGFSWTDFMLTLLSKGKMGEPFSGGIYACQLEQQHCSPRIMPDDANFDLAASALFFSVDETRKIVYVTNPWHHNIDSYDLDGRALQQELNTDSQGLLYPNSLKVMGGNSLLIADTNHHRVLLADTSDKNKGVLWSFETEKEVAQGWSNWVSLSGLSALSVEEQDAFGYSDWRYRPLSVTSANRDGFWWVVNSDYSGQASDIMLFHKTKGWIKTVQLGENADPIGIESLPGGALLTAIQSQPSLIVFGATGEMEGEFGDSTIAEYFSEARVKLQHLQSLLWRVYTGLSCFAMLMFYVLYLDKKRKQQELSAKLGLQ